MKGAREASAEIPPRRADLRRRRFELLSLWYGPESAEIEMSAHTAQPRPIGELVEAELARLHRPESATLFRIRSAWREIIGANYSRFTEPFTLQNGVLTLKVRHSALLMELQESRDVIVQRVRHAVGEDSCSSVKLIVG